MNYDYLPHIEGYYWRAMNLGDLDALVQFDKVCSEADGSTQSSSRQTWKDRLSVQVQAELNSIIAINSERNIIAAGWIHYSPELSHVRAFLDGQVHPTYRNQGIGNALLSWLESRALEHLQVISDGRDKVLRIMFYDRPPDAIELFKTFGYNFMYSEVEMKYNLRKPLPDYSLAPDTTIGHWTHNNSNEFYSIYKDAFRTRTDNLMEEAAWRFHFTNPENHEFRPGLSLMLKKGRQPVGYTICHVETTDRGEFGEDPWITQMGVRQAFRRHGYASQLLLDSLRQMKEACYFNAFLSVNLNNPGAYKLYKKIGFQMTKTFTMYSKEINS